MNAKHLTNHKFNRVFANTLSIFAILALTFPSMGVAYAQDPAFKVGLVLNANATQDNDFNWMAEQALLQAENNLGILPSVYQPGNQGEYDTLLQQCADANDLCIAVGFDFVISLANVARDNPGTQWVAVDLNYPDCWEGAEEGVNCGSFTELPNVRGLRFNEKQAGYLAGVLAGGMTSTHTIGVVGGMEIPPVVAFVEGYRNGAQCTNSAVNVLTAYTGTFVDPDVGASTAQDMIGQGADVIFGAAGLTGYGAIQYSAQSGQWAIGVDTDQYITLFDNGAAFGSDKILSSAMKRVDNAVYQTIADFVNGAFSPGTVLYDLAMDGVGLAPFHETDGSVPQEVKDNLETVKQGIINGQVDIDDPCAPPPTPFVRAHPVWDNVDAWFWPEDANLHLSIDDPDTEEAPDLEMDMPGTVDPNVGSVWFDFAGIYDLKPGDIVIMTDGSTTHSLTVSTLSIDEVDLDADTMSGTVGPETVVRLPFLDNELFVTSDSEGNWDANFAQIGFDLTPGTMFIAEVFDEDGDNSSFELYIPNPHFTVFPEWEWFDGLDWPDGATVSINVEGKPECSLERESWDGFFNGNFPEGCNIEAGDIVTFDDGMTNRWHEIRNLYVIDVNTGENTVTGKADEGETVYVWPHDGWFEPLQTIVDGSGMWQVDLDDAGYTVRDDSEGRSEIRDAMGNATASDWHVTHPHFTVFPEWEWFDGNDWPNEAMVTITVEGKPWCETAKESWGYFFNGSFGEGCDLEIGDTVTFTDGKTIRTHTVQNLAVTKANHEDDTIKGLAAPGAEVYVWPHATGEQLMATTTTKGKWHVDFSGIYDLTPGECGRSEIRDEFVNSTAVDWCISNPRIVASESGDWFWTTEFKPGDLDISIYDSADEGANLLWSGQQVADEGGFVFVGFDIHETDLTPGNFLVISDGDNQKSLILQPISVTMFDTQYDFMAGFATPGSEVWAAAGPQDWQERIMINPDPDTGEWYADFAEIGFDITEDMQYWSYAHIYDEDGDANEGNVPYLTNWVAAYTYDLPEDSFADNGVYPYHFELEWNFPRADTWEGQGGEFVVSDLAPISNGYVLLRGFRELRGLGTPEGPVCDEAGDIHPNQQMRFLFGWATDYPMTYEEALAHFDSLTVRAVWSEEMSAELTRHDIMNIDSMDWPQYVCDFTEVPPPHIVASITEDWFYLLDFAPDTSFDYSVYENYGGTPLWQGSETTDGSGFAWINADGRWDFEPGKYLVVSDGISTKELVIEGFTFDIFNAANGQLSGTVPEQYGRNLWVGVGWEGDGWSMDVTTDENGTWFADFGQPVPSDYGWVYAQLFDDDGDATEIRPASQIIFLRPACGDTYTVQAGSALEIRYGSWVAIGEELANQNADLLTVELVLNGEMVIGEKQPVVPRSEIPCGIPVEDAYGVYYVAQIGPLSPGTYIATVTWSFDEEVTDGYDANGDGVPDWYGPGEISTREFTLIVP